MNGIIYFSAKFWTELTAFLGALWAQCTQMALRKAIDLVDLNHILVFSGTIGMLVLELQVFLHGI